MPSPPPCGLSALNKLTNMETIKYSYDFTQLSNLAKVSAVKHLMESLFPKLEKNPLKLADKMIKSMTYEWYVKFLSNNPEFLFDKDGNNIFDFQRNEYTPYPATQPA